MDDLRWYLVLSPEHDYAEPIPGVPGPGPRYTVRDVAVVKARNAREAKWEAARLWERHTTPSWYSWPKLMRGEHRHPLTGVTAQRWSDLDPPPPDERDEPDPSGWRPFYSDLSDRETSDA